MFPIAYLFNIHEAQFQPKPNIQSLQISQHISCHMYNNDSSFTNTHITTSHQTISTPNYNNTHSLLHNQRAFSESYKHHKPYAPISFNIFTSFSFLPHCSQDPSLSKPIKSSSHIKRSIFSNLYRLFSNPFC